jgi:hypothetical protein
MYIFINQNFYKICYYTNEEQLLNVHCLRFAKAVHENSFALENSFKCNKNYNKFENLKKLIINEFNSFREFYKNKFI